VDGSNTYETALREMVLGLNFGHVVISCLIIRVSGKRDSGTLAASAGAAQ
jgi:hypothetical protein